MHSSATANVTAIHRFQMGAKPPCPAPRLCIYNQNCCILVPMASTPLEIAKELRLPLTRLYLLYFRQTENSHISMAQLSILMILEENGPMRISKIAATETIRMPTASNAVNQLETMDLVTRVRDTSDRRGVSVTLTDKGREELRRLSEERAEQLSSMLASLSDEELKEVAKATPVIELVLRRYTEAIEAKLNNDQH